MKWLKKLFKPKHYYQPETKKIFLSLHDFYYGRREMREFEVNVSQSGFYFQRGCGETFFLRESGELYPPPYDKGEERFKAKWFPKSGWSLDELKSLDMITEKDYKFGTLFNNL